MDELVQAEHQVRQVFCLSIDMIGSTKAGIAMTTAMHDRFNKQLVDQIRPHLEKLDLSNELLKFGGDGWLLMTDDASKVPALCCLGVVMAEVFQREMSEKTSIEINRISPLRVSVCSGRDVQVELPSGAKDWVGDSARRATRSNDYCLSNQVLIDEPVREHVFRDFNLTRLNTAKLPPDCQFKKQEEDFPLYILGTLREEAAAESQAAWCFVYTLERIGKIKEATSTAQQAAGGLRALDDWNRLVRSLPDYGSRLEIVQRMVPSGIAPDIDTGGQGKAAGRQGDTGQDVKADPETPRVSVVEVGD